MLGFAKKLDNLDVKSFDKKFSFYYHCCGKFWSNGNEKSFTKKDWDTDGFKIGLLVDFYHGSVKVFINDEDVGYAITNCDELKQGVYYVTIDNGSGHFTGSVSLSQPASDENNQ